MTTFLCNNLACLPPLTAGAERMAQADPHGWTLTLVSVGVVFAALIVLYLIYALIGRICRKVDAAGTSEAAPGSRILPDSAPGNAEMERVAAAIGVALTLYQRDCEGTATCGAASPWSDKSLTFRKLPVRK